MATPAELKSALGRAAILTRHHPGAPHTIEAQRDAAALRLEEHIRSIVDKAPPLTPRQIDKLSVLLRGGADRAS